MSRNEYFKGYMRKRRAKEKVLKKKEGATIEALQDSSYDAMTTRWCIETRMKGGDSREEAEEWCRVNSDAGLSVDASKVFHSFAVDDEPEQTPMDRCVKNRMETEGVTELEALEWCEANLEAGYSSDNKPIHPHILKQLKKTDKTVVQNPDHPCNVCHTTGSVNLWVDTDGSRRTICVVCGARKDATPAAVDSYTVDREATEYERCVGLRRDIHYEDEVTARLSCDRIMSDPMFRHYWKKELKRQADWKLAEKEISKIYCSDRALRPRMAIASEYVREHMPNLDVFSELGERIYIMKHMHGLSEDAAKKYVEQNMMREGKLANLNVPRAPGETVGDLYGKGKEQRIRENTRSKDTRSTVGSLYMKKKRGGERE